MSESLATPPPKPYKISFFNLLWPILLSLGVLAIIGYYTYKPDMPEKLAQVFNPWFLVIAIVLLVARIGAGAYRIRYVSHNHFTTGEAIRGQLIWDFFSNITPSVIGGAPFAALYIAKDANKPVGEVTAIMLYAMLLDQIWFAVAIPLMLIGSFYVEVIPKGLGFWTDGLITAYFVGMMLWVMLFAYATLVKPELLKKFAGWLFNFKLLRRFKPRVDAEMEALEERAKDIGNQSFTFYLVGFLLTAFTWLSRYAFVLFIVWSVFPDVNTLQLLLRTMAMLLLGMPIPTPGGAGGLEGLYAWFIGSLFPENLESLAPATLLVWRVLAYYLFIAIGIFLTTHQVNQSIQEKLTQKETIPQEVVP